MSFDANSTDTTFHYHHELEDARDFFDSKGLLDTRITKAKQYLSLPENKKVTHMALALPQCSFKDNPDGVTCFSGPDTLVKFTVVQKAFYFRHKLEGSPLCGLGAFYTVTHGFILLGSAKLS